MLFLLASLQFTDAKTQQTTTVSSTPPQRRLANPKPAPAGAQAAFVNTQVGLVTEHGGGYFDAKRTIKQADKQRVEQQKRANKDHNKNIQNINQNSKAAIDAAKLAKERAIADVRAKAQANKAIPRSERNPHANRGVIDAGHNVKDAKYKAKTAVANANMDKEKSDMTRRHQHQNTVDGARKGSILAKGLIKSDGTKRWGKKKI